LRSLFADAAILVEGNVERLLLPLMIEKVARRLTSSHLSIIEISGAFADRFRGLLEFLGLPTLIITDLDSVEATGHRKKCRPDDAGATTSNQILTKWLPNRTKIADLLAATPADRTSPRADTARGRIHVTYQEAVDVSWAGATGRRASRTLEEAFALDNLSWTQNEANRAIGLDVEGSAAMDLPTLAQSVFDRVANPDFKKTDFALALLAGPDEQWRVPDYITRGLQWLDNELNATVPPVDDWQRAEANAVAPNGSANAGPDSALVGTGGTAQDVPAPPVPPVPSANVPSVGSAARSSGTGKVKPQLDLDL
jgi:predicted ATP-dependent endonuclease of OLD family